MMPSSRPPGAWGDAAVAVGLAGATAAYLTIWPRDLYLFDEGVLVYEAQRVLAGDRIYRDFFEIITPGSIYAVAAAFWMFGASMATTRALNGMLHIAIVLLMFAICRGLGVRRGLAAVAALAHVALATLFLPILNPHWFSTVLALLSLWVALRRAPDGAPRGSTPAVLGALAALAILVQQHRGVVMAGAAAVVVAADAVCWRAGASARRLLIAGLLRFAAGMAALLVPAFAALLLSAGPAAVFDALVRFPLQNYHGRYNRPSWAGDVLPVPHFLRGARLLRWLPAIAVPQLLRLAALRTRGRDVFVLAMFALFSTLAAAYNPNAVHLAVVAPLFLVGVAESLEWLLRLLPRRAAAPLGWAITAALVAAIGWQARDNLRWQRWRYPIAAQTAFGHVDLQSDDELALLSILQRELPADGPREVFGYPMYAAVYPMAGATNPTRFQVLLPGYSPPEHFDEVIEVLEARRVPFIAMYGLWVNWKNDPLLRYVRTRYDRLDVRPADPARFPRMALFRRRPDGQDGKAASE